MNFLTLLLLFSMSYPMQDLKTEPASDPIDSLLADIGSEQEPGCAVSIFNNGEQLLYQARGIANMDYAIPITEESRFYMASLSKQITAATAIHLLQEEGISLSDSVSGHLELPDLFQEITFDQLLSNTSGISDLYSLLRIANISLSDVLTTEEYVRIILNSDTLVHEPGEEYSYTNSGFTLLAYAVEKISGIPFDEYAKEHLLIPLGMDNSHFHASRYTVIPNRVVSYTPDDTGFRYTYLSNFQGVGPGGFYSTHGDWMKWDQFLHHNTSPNNALSEIPALLKTSLIDSGDQEQYARGLALSTTEGVDLMGHSGSFMGFRNDYRHMPSTGTSYLITCNRGNVNAPARNLDIIRAKNQNAFQSYIRQFEGDYWNDELHVTYSLTENDGRLHLDRKGSSGQFLSESDQMIWQSGSWTFSFEQNENGEITAFTLDTGRALGIQFEKTSARPAVTQSDS